MTEAKAGDRLEDAAVVLHNLTAAGYFGDPHVFWSPSSQTIGKITRKARKFLEPVFGPVDVRLSTRRSWLTGSTGITWEVVKLDGWPPLKVKRKQERRARAKQIELQYQDEHPGCRTRKAVAQESQPQ